MGHSMRYRSRSDCPGSARAPGRAGRWARPGFHKLQECILCRIVHGAVVRACHMFAGLGEPCFDKLEAMLAHAMLSIPSTKGFVLGSGFEGTKMRGSGMQYNQLTAATSAPGLGSPRPHLHRDWAHRGHICTGTGSPQPHLRRDWAHRCHICAGTCASTQTTDNPAPIHPRRSKQTQNEGSPPVRCGRPPSERTNRVG